MLDVEVSSYFVATEQYSDIIWMHRDEEKCTLTCILPFKREERHGWIECSADRGVHARRAAPHRVRRVRLFGVETVPTSDERGGATTTRARYRARRAHYNRRLLDSRPTAAIGPHTVVTIAAGIRASDRKAASPPPGGSTDHSFAKFKIQHCICRVPPRWETLIARTKSLNAWIGLVLRFTEMHLFCGHL